MAEGNPRAVSRLGRPNNVTGVRRMTFRGSGEFMKFKFGLGPT